MRSWPKSLLILFGLTLLMTAQEARAEVSVLTDGQGRYRGTLIMYRQGDPPTDVWKKIRPVEDRFILNPGGDLWVDGMPEVAFDPVSHLPQVVWAQSTGNGYDVVFAHWDGERWTSPVIVDGQLVPSNESFSRDSVFRLSTALEPLSQPQIAVGSNRMSHVVWGGTELDPHVRYREFRLSTSEVGDTIQLNEGSFPTLHPKLLVGFDRIFVGVDQEEAGLELIVVIQADDVDQVAQRDSEPFGRRLISIRLSLSVGPSQLTLEINAGNPQARWVEDPTTMGYSDYLDIVDEWSVPYYENDDLPIP